MFGENQKISGRQLERLLVLDWIGKAGLLLPGFSGKGDGREFLLSMLLSMFLTLGYGWVLSRLSHRIENDFYGYVCYRYGQAAAVLVSLVYWLYVFVNTLFILRLFAAIAVTFVLPETKEWILIMAAAFAGTYAAAGGLEVRARFAETLYPVIVCPLALLFLFAALSMEGQVIVPRNTEVTMKVVKNGLQMFSAFGGLGLFLYLAPSVDSRKRAGQSMLRAAAATLAGEFVLFILVLRTFGENGMKALPWPIVTLMSSVEIPGGFLQRWDVIFTVLLLGSFFSAAAAGMYYLHFLAGQIFCRKEHEPWLWICAAAVTAAACICRDYQTALTLYRTLNGCLFVPAAVFLTLLLFFTETGKKKAGKYLVLAVCLFGTACVLSGCGRELEDRTFPSVLVIKETPLCDALESAQQESDKYLDYGQVKAVVVLEDLLSDGKARKDILACLEEDPVFARNILFFAGDEEAVAAAEQQADSLGDRLEDFYKNVPGRKDGGVTLGELTSFWHNAEEEIGIPRVILQEGELVLQGSLEIGGEAVPAGHFSAWKMQKPDMSGE